MTERCELSDNDEAAKQSTTSLQINNWCENEDNSTLDNTKQGTEEANDIEYCLELIPNLNDDAHSLIIEGTSQTKHENRIENLAANNVGAIHIGDRIYVNGDAEFTGNIGGSIYQKRLRESLENRSDCTKKVQSPNTISSYQKLSPKDILKNNIKRILIVLVILILISLIIAVLVHFISNFPSSFIENYESITEIIVTQTVPKNSFYIFTVIQWGGRVISNKQNLTKPATLVIIKHTNTRMCSDVGSCFTSMQILQGDGNIYEGRGWGVRNTQMDDSIDISFMGDFDVDNPSDVMLNAGQYLIRQGIDLGYLDKEKLRIVAHNQTEKTNSPGINIYKEIIKWKYYSSDIII
ncbi:peptidoglycan-recognition protein LA-like isoform X4 [Sitophilus oryzae]|uniref:Peptidoglycan-recognition protein LA-like isoform X4 n=1 Tax=Sitophilus oryzae TaxID=7048 RepID=A0A6J2YFN4_SITOR|nr:peptidoglycan-recognition protein LA-like isoform X4 [Sitophilus oryzae]